MHLDSDDLMSVTEASQRGVSRLVQDASSGRRLVFLKNNTPAAAMIDVDTMDRLQRLDALEDLEEDLKLLSIAWVRTITDSGRRYSLDEVAAEFGVDLTDDGGDED